MSCNYADGLSQYDNKGKLGLKEEFDSEEEINRKVDLLADWIENSKHVVVHTGAGISTSAGIPDFRGPNGVWTLEAKGKKPTINISFNDAIPTKTHMALKKLIETGNVQFIVSQNIDGLHLRSGVPRKYLSELHGNMFVEQCNHCHRQFVRKSATTSVGQKSLQMKCPGLRLNGRPCRGDLHDVILDWEHNLPERDLGLADFHSCCADLSICLGTTLQIVPSGTLPLNTKKYNDGRLVICNLQPTKYDKKANLVIRTYVDDIMTKLMEKLKLTIPEFNLEQDPSKRTDLIEWTIPEREVKNMRKMYEEKCCKSKRKKMKLEKPVADQSDEKAQVKEDPDGISNRLDETEVEMKTGVKSKTEIIKVKVKLENNCSKLSAKETICENIKKEPNESDETSDCRDDKGEDQFNTENSNNPSQINKEMSEKLRVKGIDECGSHRSEDDRKEGNIEQRQNNHQEQTEVLATENVKNKTPGSIENHEKKND